MRDYRDAKATARSLRDALSAKALPTTYSESKESIAKAFSYDNWNILAAKIDAAQSRAVQKSAEQGNLLYTHSAVKARMRSVNWWLSPPCISATNMSTCAPTSSTTRCSALLKATRAALARCPRTGSCTMWSTLTAGCSVVVQHYSGAGSDVQTWPMALAGRESRWRKTGRFDGRCARNNC